MEQVLPAIREGERITGDGELGVTLLADLEQIGDRGGARRSRAARPRRSTSTRGTRRASSSSRASSRSGSRTASARRAGDMGRSCRRRSCTRSRVTGDDLAHFLDLHVPSCGFGDFVRGLYAAETEDELRAVRAAFDQQPAPEYASADPGPRRPPPRGEDLNGETITARPERRATLLVDADELTVTEFSYGPGERGAKLHVHHHHADAFLVVEGELTFASRDGSVAAPAGTLVLFPPASCHGFDNDSARKRALQPPHPASGFADYLRGRNPELRPARPSGRRRRRPSRPRSRSSPR